MRYLILGAKGQLGRTFCEFLSQRHKYYIPMGKDELDVTDLDMVQKVLKDVKPDVVINCSAYNLVDQSEREFEKALLINSFGPRNLSMVCRDLSIFLVHYSTDYVFDGKKEGFYEEEDQPNPLNKYGMSKWIGEQEIQSIMKEKFLIFRTSWVYGKGKQNFLFKLTEWVKSGNKIKIACDEFSVPTYTKTIVEVTFRAIDAGLQGIYHLVNSGYASRYEWAKAYFEFKGVRVVIYPGYQAEFNLPAVRLKWSVLSNAKLCKELGIEIKDWQIALRDFIHEN